MFVVTTLMANAILQTIMEMKLAMLQPEPHSVNVPKLAILPDLLSRMVMLVKQDLHVWHQA